MEVNNSVKNLVKNTVGEVRRVNESDESLIDEAKETAHKEGDRIKVAAQAEIDQEVNRAKETLRTQVSTLAVAGASKILETSIDVEKHNALLDKLAEEL